MFIYKARKLKAGGERLRKIKKERERDRQIYG